MSKMLFYMGQGADPVEAIRAALSHCAAVLEKNPSLLIELQETNHCGTHWEAHIRLMALAQEGESGKAPKSKKDRPPDEDRIPISPEHFRSGSPFAWRSVGMVNEVTDASGGFDIAAHGGYIPDIPLQDIEFLAKSGWTEVEMRTHAASNIHDPVVKSDDPKLNYD